MRRSIVNNSAEGEAVYEPFSGSGTTIIAAEVTGRVCLAMEISPAYCDLAVERWQAMTGQPAVLDTEDRIFDDVAAARRRELAA
jgi:DNA modification methylase